MGVTEHQRGTRKMELYEGRPESTEGTLRRTKDIKLLVEMRFILQKRYMP
jgi:hypothetical protein